MSYNFYITVLEQIYTYWYYQISRNLGVKLFASKM